MNEKLHNALVNVGVTLIFVIGFLLAALVIGLLVEGVLTLWGLIKMSLEALL